MRLRHQSQKIDVLKKVPLFGDLNQRQLSAIARHADETEIAAGRVLLMQGEVGQEMLVLLDGRARVERDGKVVSHLGPGDVAGEMALIDGKPRSATVIAEEPCRCLVMMRREFMPLLDTVPGLSAKLLITLCGRLRDTTELLVS